MPSYLKRLASVGAAYQAADMLAKGVALFTLPLYTRHLSRGDYGAAETLLTAVILGSIILRLGVGEAFVRFYFDDADPARRARIAALTVRVVVVTTTPVALALVLAAQPLSKLLLGYHDATLLALAILGLWTFTNLEVAYALLRVDERAGTYLRASLTNVALTVLAQLTLVVFLGARARGLLAGNFGASTLVLFGLWWAERERLKAGTAGGPGRGTLARMLAFGLPTVAADAGVYALQVIDRAYLFRVQSHATAGVYALAVKLATVVFVFVRGFQYAWPPLAYSVESDAEAGRLYALVTTYYVLATGIVVAGVALLGRWLVRLLAAPSFYAAHRALPWLALGWALYGLYLVFVVIAGRARATRRNLPAALAGLLVNVAGLLLLVPELGIAGAGIALCAAYLAMLGVMFALTRKLFTVGFEWGRLGRLVGVLGGGAALGDVLLPTAGLAAFTVRTAVLLGLPVVLWASGFFRSGELGQARALARRAVSRLRPT